MSEMKRTVLWIDPHIEYRSPTMRHLLHALPHLRAAGWEVKVWCLRSDLPRDEIEHIFFPAAAWLGQLQPIYFLLIANLDALLRWLCGTPRPADVIHANCGNHLGADVVSVQFLNSVWAGVQLRLGFSNWREVVRYPLVLFVACIEWLQWRSPALRLVLAVSDSIAAEVRARAPMRVEVETLANTYDETRFNPGVRALHREAVRRELGFGESEKVFCFVSTGHYRRKGFWLAVEALAQVRGTAAGQCVRLLVVGGSEASVGRLRAQAAADFPGSDKWITFAGMQREVERFYAASDAFLFPSHFEAFCLAEIEAAACGLPLLLTPHHGSEMILRDGVNGVRLSFDPKMIGSQVTDFLAKGLPDFEPGSGRGLTKGEYASLLLGVYERLASETRD